MISEQKLEQLKKEFSSYYLEFYLKEIEKSIRRNWYEKLCAISSKILPIRPIPFYPIKFYPLYPKNLSETIIFSGLNVLPNEVISLTILSFLILSAISLVLYFIFTDIGIFIFALPIGIAYILYTYPDFRAKVNRIQTNSEAIKIITYLVLYLETTPNFEGAIDFAAKRVKGIISDDMKKISWDIRTGKFSTLKEALEHYIPKWLKWNENFVRALILLSNISYVTSNEERKSLLRKTLDFILTKNLEETKVYVEKVRGPITLLFLFGLLMPSIGLIMFPMISVFLHFSVKPSYIIFGYLVVLPLMNYYLITRVISLRPGAFLIVDISKHPKLPPENYFYYRNVLIPIIPLSILVFALVSFYGINHIGNFYIEFNRQLEINPKKAEEMLRAENNIQNYAGLAASFSITLGFGLAAFLYFYLNSFQKVRIRKEVKDIEEDLPNLLITSGNFLEAGYPFEKTIEKTLEEYERLGMKEKAGYKFYSLLKERIVKFGENIYEAIFGSNGLIYYFPSVLLEEVFRIITETSKKSVRSAGTIAKTISRYLENIWQTEFRLKELLADVRGNLKMQAQFLIPIITGVISATGIFIISLLSFLADYLSKFEKSFGITSGISEVINVMVGDFKRVIPMPLLQAVVGCYTVIAIILMSYLLSGVENGFDRVARDDEISQNLKFGLIIYFIIGIASL
ncbi:MAG: hypothetical protein QW409_03855, partial [Candidatus Aenigmatarchaeota archaeon]